MTWSLVGIALWALLLYQLSPSWCLSQLRNSSTLSRNFATCIAALAVLWHLKIELIEGLALHFLLVTAVTLILGFRISCIATSSAMLLLAATNQITWQQLPEHWLIHIFPIIVMSYLLLLISRKYLPRHLFVYIFVNAFLTAAVAIALSIGIQALWYNLTGQYSSDQINQYLLRMLPLMVFPEALLNGMLITVLAVYTPHNLCTYRDSEYLNN
ncbi:energy-coupling factor ABC transporter permease [Neiella marina]|uniref:Energy-coupling factor ABC transporter permease n=1 Tax=Neiella holothuriorum TaxID=2870530 RepID=A0ABS7EJ78_9GAMM|nr:energy-coupling factor ABC transporter permease [Neiella holothuriorum]MBW8192408.1 energy-coupling factor ABC transporter permease [Neiella holothuriorum]